MSAREGRGPVSLKLNSCQIFPVLRGYDRADGEGASLGPSSGRSRGNLYGFALPWPTDQTYAATAIAWADEIPPGYATIKVDGTPWVAT
jgi:hypothetical protein